MGILNREAWTRGQEHLMRPNFKNFVTGSRALTPALPGCRHYGYRANLKIFKNSFSGPISRLSHASIAALGQLGEKGW